MYTSLDLYEQLLNVRLQMDAAAKPKVVFFFSLDLLNLNQKIGLKVVFGIALPANDKHHPASYI